MIRSQQEQEERILEILAETGGSTWDCAAALCDEEVAAGEYAGCSTDLEIAFTQYEADAERILAAAGG